MRQRRLAGPIVLSLVWVPRMHLPRCGGWPCRSDSDREDAKSRSATGSNEDNSSSTTTTPARSRNTESADPKLRD